MWRVWKLKLSLNPLAGVLTLRCVIHRGMRVSLLSWIFSSCLVWRGRQSWDPLAGVLPAGVLHTGEWRCLSLAKYSPAVSVERQTELRPTGRASPHVCHDALGQHHTEQERSCIHCNIKTIRRATAFYSYVLKRKLKTSKTSRRASAIYCPMLKK